jgi:hypothetical protein
MKSAFPGYYPLTSAEMQAIWNECFFVPDANVLLNVYRYSEETTSAFLLILTSLKERLWLPHQVGLEFQRNRRTVIAKQVSAFQDITKQLDGAKNAIEKSFSEYSKHPTLKGVDYIPRIDELFKTIKEELAEKNRVHPKLLDNDDLYPKLSELFEGQVGPPFNSQRLDDIYKTGEIRYSRFVPPGYADAKEKPGNEKYGDFVVWLQIIEYAKVTKKPVILITDDAKEDWWLKFKGKTLGPRPELIQEMLDEAGVRFHIYSTDEFMKYAGEYTKSPVNQGLIEEVKDLREDDDRQRTMRSEESLLAKNPDFSTLPGQEERIKGILTWFRREEELLRRRSHDEELVRLMYEKVLNPTISRADVERWLGGTEYLTIPERPGE